MLIVERWKQRLVLINVEEPYFLIPDVYVP